MKRVGFWLCLFLVGVSLFFYWQKNKTPTPEKSLHDLHGHHLVVYSSMRDEVGRALLMLFQEQTGCAYEYIHLPTQTALARVRREQQKPIADVLLGGALHAQMQAAAENLTEPLQAQALAQLPPAFRSADRRWAGIAMTPLAIIVHQKQWQKIFGARPWPQTYTELLSPDFQGKISFADPNVAGTSYTLLAYMTQDMNAAKRAQCLTSLRQNVDQLAYSGYESVERVASGDYPLGIGFLDDADSLKASGFPLLTIVPEDAAWTLDAVAVIQHAPDEKAAQAFAAFCLEKNTQKLLSRIAFSSPTLPMTAEDDSQTALHLGKMDFVRAGREQQDILDTWAHAKQDAH